MTRFLKHVGVLKNTSKRIAIVMHEIPNSQNQALVCDMEALPPRLHDAVLSILESSEAQEGPIKDLYELLARRLFPDSSLPVINELHYRGYLSATPQSNVIVMPRPNVQIPLDVLIIEMKKFQETFSQKNPSSTNTVNDNSSELLNDLPAHIKSAAMEAKRQLESFNENQLQSTDVVQSQLRNNDSTVGETNKKLEESSNQNLETTKTVEKFNQYVHNQNVEKNESKIAIAQSLLKQAELLSQEASALIKKAFAMAPELDVSKQIYGSENSVSTTVVREKVVTNSDLVNLSARSRINRGKKRPSVNLKEDKN